MQMGAPFINKFIKKVLALISNFAIIIPVKRSNAHCSLTLIFNKICWYLTIMSIIDIKC